MRLVTFQLCDPPWSAPHQVPSLNRTGVVSATGVVDLTDPILNLPSEMPALLALGPAVFEQIAVAHKTVARRYDLDTIRLRAPISLPPKVLVIGLNHRSHVRQRGIDPPDHQYWLNKQHTSVIGTGDAIVIPAQSEKLNYEGELALVVGRYARTVPAATWRDVIAGFTIVNDASVRLDYSPTFGICKSLDTFCPMGPWLITKDEIADVESLRIRTWVNDELRQDGTTADLIFSPGQMIEYLTSVFTLEPGDVLATGTPAGTGADMNPPRWLTAGDVVRIEIEHVGTLENPVEARR